MYTQVSANLATQYHIRNRMPPEENQTKGGLYKEVGGDEDKSLLPERQRRINDDDEQGMSKKPEV